MPDGKIRAFTDAEMSALKDVVRWHRTHHGLGQNRRGRDGIDGEDTVTPEVYAALTPADGIPARSGLTPGDADCTIYRVLDGQTGTGTGDATETFTLEEADTFEREVLNLSESAVAGETFVLIVKDKYGTWWVVNGGGESTFLALLTGKTYFDNESIAYSWQRVADSEGILPLTYTAESLAGWLGHNPAYHLNKRDYPVCHFTHSGTGTGTGADFLDHWSVVRLWAGGEGVADPAGTGSGTAQSGYYVFDQVPVEDLFRRTGVEDADGEIAYIRYFDQNDGAWKDGREVRLIAAE